MTKYQVLLLAVMLACAASAVNAEVIQMKCEFWHKRLGQLADNTYTIDLDAKNCNGHSCKISETELKWSEEGGRMEVTLNRVTGDGTLLVPSEETGFYKGCTSAKPKT